jgi:hypothetical protein
MMYSYSQSLVTFWTPFWERDIYFVLGRYCPNMKYIVAQYLALQYNKLDNPMAMSERVSRAKEAGFW